MRLSLLLWIGILMMVSACSSSTTDVQYELGPDSGIGVVDGNIKLILPEEDKDVVCRILRSWLPRMRTASADYPTPIDRIIVIDVDPSGTLYERMIFVGSNWIGDGQGVATLADTEAFRLRAIIERAKSKQLSLDDYVEQLPNREEFRLTVSRASKFVIHFDRREYVYDSARPIEFDEVKELLLSDELQPRETLMGLSVESSLSAFEGDLLLFDLRWQNDSNIRVFEKYGPDWMGTYRVTKKWREKYLSLLK